MLIDIANGCKGSEGTITLGPSEAQELIDMVKENGQEGLLEEASSSTSLLTGKNKDEESAKRSHEAPPDGTFVSLGNGGIEISCITLNEIVFADENSDRELSPKKKKKASSFASQLAAPLSPKAAKSETGDESEPSEVAGLNVADASEVISKMRSLEKLQHILDTDTRTGVKTAAQKRLGELIPA